MANLGIVVRNVGANQNHRVLDVVERQVLLVCDPRVQGCGYEHHLLLLHGDRDVWIALDTRNSVEAYRMGEEPEIIPLVAGAEFPARGRPILALRDLTPAELAGARERAARLGELLGFSQPAAETVISQEWVFSDSAHPRFGQLVPGVVVLDPQRFVTRESRSR